MSTSPVIPIIPVSQPVIASVQSLLADPGIGFNPTMLAVAGAFPPCPVITIDFSHKSPNFYQGWYSPEILAQTSAIQYPLMTLYGMTTENTHEQISAPFSGPVQIGLDIHLSWMKTQALHNTESLCSAVESTIYTLFQPEVGIVYIQGSLINAGISLTGFGKIKITRTPLRADAQHWLQSIKAVLSFSVVAGN